MANSVPTLYLWNESFNGRAFSSNRIGNRLINYCQSNAALGLYPFASLPNRTQLKYAFIYLACARNCLNKIFKLFQVSFESNYEAGKIFGHGNDEQKEKSVERIKRDGIKLIDVQCFPFYSILLAVGRTRVDYFSLDVEGAESQILFNVPWHLVDVKVSDRLSYIIPFHFSS